MGHSRHRRAAIGIGIIVAMGLGAVLTGMVVAPGHPADATIRSYAPQPSYHPGLAPPVATGPAAGSMDIDRYLEMVLNDNVDRLNAATSAVFVCPVSDAACIAGLQRAIATVDVFAQEFDAATPPACAADLATVISTALADYRTGLTLALAGIEDGLPSRATNGIDQVIASEQSFNGALNEMTTGACGTAGVSL